MLGQIVIEKEPVVRYRKHSNNLSGSKLRTSPNEMNERNEEENSILWNFLDSLTIDKLHYLLGSWIDPSQKFEGLSKQDLVSAIESAHPRMTSRPKPA